MFLDGLEDAYDKGRLMGTFAEECADKYAFTREAQDEFALTSLSRALAANNDGTFAWEIAPVTVSGRKGDVVIDQRRAAGEGVAGQDSGAEAGVSQGRHRHRRQLELDLRRRRGAGADASLDGGKARLEPLAVIVAHATHAQEPGAVHDRAGRRDREAVREDAAGRTKDVDLFEINEAFAVVTMAAMKEHGIAARDASTSTAAPARSAIRSARRARASSSP